ncbi:hypothetical protein HN873_070715 [Arachis hypogaea]
MLLLKQVRKLEFLIAFLVFTIAAYFFAELGCAKPVAKEVLKGLFVPELKGSGATDYPVYHSLYDDFIWMQKFGDPMFHRHVAGWWHSISFFSLCHIKLHLSCSRPHICLCSELCSHWSQCLLFRPPHIFDQMLLLLVLLYALLGYPKEIEASKGWRTWKEYQMKVRCE